MEVCLRASTVGEFELHVSAWLLDPENPGEEIDAIADFDGDDAKEQADRWATHEGYTVVERSWEVLA
jgi:hypothetical protein